MNTTPTSNGEQAQDKQPNERAALELAAKAIERRELNDLKARKLVALNKAQREMDRSYAKMHGRCLAMRELIHQAETETEVEKIVVDIRTQF